MRNRRFEKLKSIFACNKLQGSFHWKCFALSFLIYLNALALFWCEWHQDDVSVKKVGDSQFHIQHGKCGSSYFYVPITFILVLYVLLIIEAFHCQLRRELQSKTHCKKGYDLIDKYKRAYPIIWWRVICYHYAKRSRQTTSYRNGDAYVTTQDYYERVNTHTALAAFDFSNCGVVDKTTEVINLEKNPIVSLKFNKTFGFSNVDAENDYLLQRSKFFEENEARDEYIETYEGMNLTDVEFKDNMTVFQDSASLPWYVSHAFFWVTTVLVLSWPFRIFVSFKTVHMSCVVEKVFGTRYDNPPCSPALPPPPLLVQQPRDPPNMCEELNNAISVSEILPSYSDVMLNERLRDQSNTKFRSVSIQVDPKRAESRTSFSHIIEDDFMNLVACTHEGSQSHQMPLNNVELNPRYQRNRLYKIKCQSFNDKFSEDDNGDGEDFSNNSVRHKKFMRKSKSFVQPVKQLSPLCESLLSDSEC